MARRSTRHTVPVNETEEHQPGVWRPLTVRGVPLHVVVPAIIAVIGVSMLVAGGLTAVLGAWILTIGFSLSVGAFVADQRALAVPAAVWAAWLLVTALAGDGSSLPRTPPALAIVLAALGAACVWLGQRAVQPAVEGARASGRDRQLDTDIDALLEPVHTADDSLSLDPNAEVDEALAALLLEDDAETAAAEAEVEAETETEAEAEAEPEADAGTQADADAIPSEAPEDDDTGHVIEFEALSEDDLQDEDAPLPAATEAGRRRGGTPN